MNGHLANVMQDILIPLSPSPLIVPYSDNISSKRLNVKFSDFYLIFGLTNYKKSCILLLSN